MDIADLAMTAARGGHFAASLSAFGILLFWALVAPPVLRQAQAPARARIELMFLRLFRVSLGMVLVAALVWLALEAAYMADAETMADAAAALWPVLTDTHFGRVLSLRLALLVLSGVLLGKGAGTSRRALAAGAAGLALMLHTWFTHAAAAEGIDRPILMSVESLHLLAAGAWLGSLAPLFIAIGLLPAEQGARAAHRFSPLGMVCATVLVATALTQSWVLIGGLPGLFGTGYGLTALTKLMLLLSLLALAALNRFRFLPALSGPAGADAKRRLRRSIAVETAVGLAAVFAAAYLSSLAPATHERPVWPFAWQPNLGVLADPDLGPRAIRGLAILGVALLMVAVGVIRRRLLPLLIIVAAMMTIWAVPQLDLLVKPAYPTSFFRSPTGFAAATIARGAGLFAANCTACHGAAGRGDGPAAKSLPVLPADLVAPHLWFHSDGELFWWISHGIEGPKGQPAMPGFAASLSEKDRWALIDYLHAHNAGGQMAATGRWEHPVQAPGLTVDCGGNHTVTLADLRGTALIITAVGSSDATAPAPLPASLAGEVKAIWLAPDSQIQPPAGLCVSADPSAWAAYAIVGGVDPGALAGTEFLVDARGWLRARWRPGDPNSWGDPAVLESKIEEIRSHPILVKVGGRQMMMMHHQQ